MTPIRAPKTALRIMNTTILSFQLLAVSASPVGSCLKCSASFFRTIDIPRTEEDRRYIPEPEYDLTDPDYKPDLIGVIELLDYGIQCLIINWHVFLPGSVFLLILPQKTTVVILLHFGFGKSVFSKPKHEQRQKAAFSFWKTEISQSKREQSRQHAFFALQITKNRRT